MSINKQNGETRDKILIAAAQMLGENPFASLSVRAVAARANVSTGSLRHFFPTQKLLVQTVVAGLRKLEIASDVIEDTTRSPEERLVCCLDLLLAQLGEGEQARATWRDVYEAYFVESVTLPHKEQLMDLEKLGRSRIERWLTVLASEGRIPSEEIETRARFLSYMISGIFTERALPAEEGQRERENRTVRFAVRAVLRPVG